MGGWASFCRRVRGAAGFTGDWVIIFIELIELEAVLEEGRLGVVVGRRRILHVDLAEGAVAVAGFAACAQGEA